MSFACAGETGVCDGGAAAPRRGDGGAHQAQVVKGDWQEKKGGAVQTAQ